MICRTRLLSRLLPLALLVACSPGRVRYQPLAGPPAGGEPVEAVLYLVGDAGEVSPEREEVLTHLRQNIDSIAGGADGPPVVVAFLGDNIYDEGAPSERTSEDVEKLGAQVLAVGSAPNVHGVFVPGNHDWANGASLVDGRAAIVRQEEWVESFAPGRRVRFLPDDGCPGPASEDIGSSVHLVFIDTEWLLRKPELRCGTAAAFYERLSDDLRRNADKRVVVLSHHPLVSGGPHGGHVAPLERGPLVYYLAVKSGVSLQDLTSRRYATVIRRLRQAYGASGHPPLIHAAGHDHTLQVIGLSGPGQPRYQLVSGSASKTSPVRRIEGMRYATDGFGYMRLDFSAVDARLVVYAREVDGGPVRPVFACVLTTEAAEGDCPEAPLLGGGR